MRTNSLVRLTTIFPAGRNLPVPAAASGPRQGHVFWVGRRSGLFLVAYPGTVHSARTPAFPPRPTDGDSHRGKLADPLWRSADRFPFSVGTGPGLPPSARRRRGARTRTFTRSAAAL